MLTRRIVVSSLLCAPALHLIPRSIFAAEQMPLVGNSWMAQAPRFDSVPIGQAPGDYGYCHDKYHPCYQALFGKLGNCSCGDGDCRVTIWRVNHDSPKGYEVVIERAWYPLQANTWLPPEDSKMIPPELLFENAHVCAYTSGGGRSGFPTLMTIACALINKNAA